MKKLSLFVPIITLVLALSACKKNSVEEQYTETIHQVVPDLSTQINASVDGFITDENGVGIEAAEVKAGSLSALTDQYGYFKITNVSLAKDAGFIKVSKAGYFTGFRTFLPQAGKQTFVRLQLIPKTITGTVGAGTGGIVSTTGGASVTLPVNAVVIASNNTPYSGTVNIAIQWLNPDDMDVTQLTMPGDLRGIDQSGYLNTLTTYGMLAVELTSDAGELLQVAAGQIASLNFPIPASLQAAAPASIPLWYFNEANGLWQEDGAATKNGGTYNGTVSHFTYWNCDIPSSTVNFNAQIVDMSLAPIANVPVSIAIAGSPNSARTCYTNANGEVSGGIPANSNLIIYIESVCTSVEELYHQDITTTNSAVDLGSVKINLNQYEAVLKGYVKKCNGSPVTDGYVIIATGLSNKVVEIQNGDFYSTTNICPNANASVIAFDRETSEQSDVQSLVVVTGTNDFDTLHACAAAPIETITYTLDGIPTTLTVPWHDFAGNFDFGNNRTTFNAVDLVNSITVFDLTCNGPDAPGSYPVTGTVTLDQAYQFNPPANITITSYGLVGEFITATISGTLDDLAVGNSHTFSCTINIKRDL